MPASIQLKDDAVQSVFVFSKQVKRRRTSEQRQHKHTKSELVESSLKAEKQISRGTASCSYSNIETFKDDHYETESDHELDSSLRSEEVEMDTFDDLSGKADFLFVRLNQLKLLFKFCMQCGSTATVTKCHTIGATVFISVEYTSGHKLVWDSLDYDYAIFSSANLLSGSTYQPFYESMKIAKVKFFE